MLKYEFLRPTSKFVNGVQSMGNNKTSLQKFPSCLCTLEQGQRALLCLSSKPAIVGFVKCTAIIELKDYCQGSFSLHCRPPLSFCILYVAALHGCIQWFLQLQRVKYQRGFCKKIQPFPAFSSSQKIYFFSIKAPFELAALLVC